MRPFDAPRTPKLSTGIDNSFDRRTGHNSSTGRPIPEVKLPKASQEDLLQANALYRLEQQWSVLGKILEIAPDTITGISGELQW